MNFQNFLLHSLKFESMEGDSSSRPIRDRKGKKKYKPSRQDDPTLLLKDSDQHISTFAFRREVTMIPFDSLNGYDVLYDLWWQCVPCVCMVPYLEYVHRRVVKHDFVSLSMLIWVFLSWFWMWKRMCDNDYALVSLFCIGLVTLAPNWCRNFLWCYRFNLSL